MIDKIINKLGEKGYSIDENLFSLQDIQMMNRFFNSKNKEFLKATIGNVNQILDKNIRSDSIYWIEEKDKIELHNMVSFLEDLRLKANENFYLGLFDFESHFAKYEKNTFYKKHLDAFQKNNARKLTFILYLNEAWQEGDGGELKIYLNKDNDNENLIVKPKAGTLVTFFSEEFYHEVLPSQKERRTYTGWFKTR